MQCVKCLHLLSHLIFITSEEGRYYSYFTSVKAEDLSEVTSVPRHELKGFSLSPHFGHKALVSFMEISYFFACV